MGLLMVSEAMDWRNDLTDVGPLIAGFCDLHIQRYPV
jgi:hypothetical protein